MAKATQSRTTVTGNADIPDSTVAKMGRALAEIAEVEQELASAVSAAATERDRMQLAEQADRAITDAVTDQGLSLTQFNQVVQAADEDQELRDRLTAAIRAA
ncbi:MAG TPA: DUF4168 domain-containing protein [Acetobacteraceae bacterium]|jgi:hypothetical protein|nr:DUF4168 domain-containing protein [Acetobacteraceae bacterium]